MTSTKILPIRDYSLGIFDGPHATPDEAEAGPYFLGIRNITEDGRLDFSEPRYVSESEFPRWTKRVQPAPGDVVFTYEATLHRYALIPAGFRGCLGRRVALVRPDPSKVDSRFLLFYFLSSGWRAVVESNVISGATVDRIPLERFPTFPAALPPLPAQRRIADAIASYNDLIDNNRRRIKLLEDSVRLLFDEWFVRLRFPGHQHSTALEGIPSGWVRSTLGQVTRCLEDGDWIESKDQGGEDFRLLQISNVGINEFRETGNLRFISEETFRRLRCREITPGMILIARMPTPIGRAMMITEMPWRMVTAVDVAIVEPDDELVDRHYLLHHLNSAENLARCEGRTVGATRPRVTRRELAELPLLVPDKGTQQAFKEVAADVQAQRHILSRQIDKLSTARDLLLPRLMSGELAV